MLPSNDTHSSTKKSLKTKQRKLDLHYRKKKRRTNFKKKRKKEENKNLFLQNHSTEIIVCAKNQTEVDQLKT